MQAVSRRCLRIYFSMANISIQPLCTVRWVTLIVYSINVDVEVLHAGSHPGTPFHKGCK